MSFFSSRSKYLYFMLVALLALPAIAQEQTGGIEGVVKDSAGAALPGATIEARSPAIGVVNTATDSTGTYRFPRLPSGVYTVRVSLMGFNTSEAKDVDVTLGRSLTLNFTLGLSTVAETITVTAEAPILNVTQSATATSFSREQIELIGRGRDFTAIAANAPGASNEPFVGGISIDGASGSENRFIIDGIDTTHPQDGISGQNLVSELVEEIQVKSAGYAAEFGGAIGGVINAVTKTGTNDFDGSVGVYYNDRSWDGEERRTPYRADPSLYRTFSEDDVIRMEPFFSIGGPIIRDNLWFYLGHYYTEVENDRVPDGSSQTFSQTDTREYWTGNLKGNAGSRFLYKLSANFAPREIDNQLPARDGTTPAGTNLNIDNDYQTESYSAYADFIPGSSFYLSGRVGFYTTDQETLGLPPVGTNRIFFRNGVIPVPTTDPRYRPTGFATVPGATHTGTAFDLWERESASLDANLFVNAFGSHAFKAGVQHENIFNDVATGEVGNLFEVRWGLPDRFGAGVQGTQGSVHVRRFGTFGAAESNNLGFYLQDSWQIVPSFTLNVGVRTEKEEVPNYAHSLNPESPVNAWEFDYGDKLAPRLGFAWDVMSNQKMKVYGSWGLYYDISKLDMSRGSFGGDKWIAYLYPLNTLDWETLPAGCTTSVNDPAINPCPNLGVPDTLDLRHPADPTDPVFGVDPDLRPMEQEEWQIGSDYLLTPNSTVGIRYVNKSLNTGLEDIGFFACTSETECQEAYFVGNPGKGPTAADPAGPIPAQPLATRDYQAVELSYNRRFVNNWSARIGYTFSELEGNWSGLGSSDEFGRTDPNVSRAFDYLHNAFDRQGRPVFGPLNTDRPHQLDAQVLYRFFWGTTAGLNQYYGSGTPISTQVFYAGVPFFAFGRKDAGRTDALTSTDLLLTHPFHIGSFAIEASLNVQNLFDEDTALLLDPYSSEGDLCSAIGPECDRTQDYFFNHVPFDVSGLLNPAQANPFYLRPNTVGSTLDPFQARRSVKLGVKFTF